MKAIIGLDLRLSSAIAKQRSLCAEFVWPAEARASPLSSPSAFSGLSVGTAARYPLSTSVLIGPVVEPLRRAADLTAIGVTAALRERVFPGVIQTRNRSGPHCRLVLMAPSSQDFEPLAPQWRFKI
ncbi:hypothetical protein [Bradyrhizobium sp. WU425]|uniref:hypothetical protein n=1 Tax=Bradyrhizobium sp. WU425 TaxID=187029 RepID=UPI001E45BD2F|nr:hypothetical protein [Bradyrhizobium canariense]UFW71384.1 hypothetical protein BcanWU425_32865 [Bradyrhizobium canariense]